MESRNSRALKGLAVFLAAMWYVGAVVFGDIMFLSVMQEAFPTGFLGTLAMVGAVMTAASAITLPIALHWWFHPGLQFIWGLLFWVIDIAVLSLNSVLAYQQSTGLVDPTLAMWGDFSPATPMLAVIGWGLAFLLDPSHQLRHAELEGEADSVDTYTKALKLANQSNEVYAIIQKGAEDNARLWAERMIGKRLPDNVIEGVIKNAPLQPKKSSGLLERMTGLFKRDRRPVATVTDPPSNNHHGELPADPTER